MLVAPINRAESTMWEDLARAYIIDPYNKSIKLSNLDPKWDSLINIIGVPQTQFHITILRHKFPYEMIFSNNMLKQSADRSKGSFRLRSLSETLFGKSILIGYALEGHLLSTELTFPDVDQEVYWNEL